MTATASVRHAARGDSMKRIARLGLAARALIYLLIGVLAIALANGSRRNETDQRGALQALTRHTGGTALVWVIAVGLAAYALWRFSEAAFGVVGEGHKAGPRVQSFVRGLIYAFFAVSAFKLVIQGRSGSQAGQQELFTAKAMRHTGGRWAVGIVGAIVVICGLVLAWQGLTRKFEKYLNLGQMSRNTRRVVEIMGVFGTAARGVVFALAGVFVIVAAVQYDPRKAGGLDGALRELADSSTWSWLLYVIAAGLVVFGVYGFAEAKWRRT
ncbi:MAG: DUF1206 domain-containing protein [Jatrophihabitantaceae bacterium]